MRMQQSCLNIMTETTINSILTFISIICAIRSYFYATRTLKVKDAVFKKLDIVDLMPEQCMFDLELSRGR